MNRRDFLGHTDREVVRSTPYCLPFDFVLPPVGFQDSMPASAIGAVLKRCYQPDLPQVGWKIEHAGHWWEGIGGRLWRSNKDWRRREAAIRIIYLCAFANIWSRSDE
jgi:hypothetical protein